MRNQIDVDQITWDIIPQNRSIMILRSICYFKTRGDERNETKSDKRRRQSITM